MMKPDMDEIYIRK